MGTLFEQQSVANVAATAAARAVAKQQGVTMAAAEMAPLLGVPTPGRVMITTGAAAAAAAGGGGGKTNLVLVRPTGATFLRLMPAMVADPAAAAAAVTAAGSGDGQQAVEMAAMICSLWQQAPASSTAAATAAAGVDGSTGQWRC